MTDDMLVVARLYMRDSRDGKDEDIDEDEIRLGRGPPPVAWAVLPLTTGRPGITHNLCINTLGLDHCKCITS